MELTTEQRLARLESAFTFKPDGTVEIKREANPVWSDDDVTALSSKLKLSTGATTSPVTTPPAPVVTAGLLPNLKEGFKLKGFEKAQEAVDVLKGRVYDVRITITKVDGGGVHAQFRHPDGSGFGNPGKLGKGLNQFTITSPVTGSRLFSVEANGANVEVAAVTLTLKNA